MNRISLLSMRVKQRNAITVGCIVGGMAIAVYTVIIAPKSQATEYMEIQRKAREQYNDRHGGIAQPGDMQQWKDPFDRKK
eukprot:CFRG7507T1